VATVINDVLQLVLSGLYASQVWENVFFYRVEDAPTGGILTGLATEFQAEVLAVMAAAQNDATAYDQIIVRNIFSGDEAVVAPLTPVMGSVSGSDVAPSFIAASIKLVRGNARVRHGRKSLIGMSEANMNGQIWTSGFQTDLQAVADAFAAQLNPGLADLLAPIIVGRVEYVPDPDEPDHFAYRLPESQAEMDDNWAYVVSGQASTVITTQNSRKQGHGT